MSIVIYTWLKKIVDILAVIDSIAFHTDILALNAAVEAARAGEQGRGFAVVASEVRSLTQRAASAAKEIKILIGDSLDKVDVGSRLVTEAGSTMDELVGSVQYVTNLLSAIMAATTEQSTGIAQVNQASAQRDPVTQQNAALVEEAAAAAESLRSQADGLAQSVAMFRLGSHAGHTAAATRPVATNPASVAPPAARPGRVPPWRQDATWPGAVLRTPPPAQPRRSPRRPAVHGKYSGTGATAPLSGACMHRLYTAPVSGVSPGRRGVRLQRPVQVQAGWPASAAASTTAT